MTEPSGFPESVHDTRPLPVIALTGGSGFVGRVVTERLLDQSYTVRSLYRRPPPRPDLRLDIRLGSLDDEASLRSLVAGAEIVIHIAGLTAARSTAEFDHVNGEGARRLAMAARDTGVRRFLLISSLAAREPALSPYAASKRAGEIALAETGGMSWDILRPPAVYGPDDRALLQLLGPLKRRIALLPAGGDARASVIHIDDLASAISAWVAAHDTTRTAYEIDDGKTGGYTWRELMQTAAAALGVSPLYLKPPASLLDLLCYGAEAHARITGKAPFLSLGKLREMRHSDWVADSTAFAHAAHWRPRIPFAEGIAATVEAYRRQGLL